MQAILKVAGTKFLIGYVLLYAAALWHLSRQPGFELGEALAVLVIVGILLSSLALLFTRKAEPMPLAVKSAVPELVVLLLWLAPVCAYLVWGAGSLRSAVPKEPAQSVVIAMVKLALVVAIPAALLMRGWGYRIGELASMGMRWKQLKPALWMSLAVLVMQAMVGRGLRDLAQANAPAWLATIAAPLAFVWLALETGLVEEFFFRVLLQTRLARVCGSELGGILAASVLFGLVHAPGFYLRTSATLEALGPSPSLATALAYSLAVTSVAGIFLGVLWARTRNLAVPVIVHAAADLIPNLLPFLKAWHLH